MGRVNKAIEGVFTEIVGTDKELSSYDVFLKYDEEPQDVKAYVSKYRESITKLKSEFERLSLLEEIIMQIRSKANMSDIKLSLVREYIYARCSFYRRGKTAKDIRVIVDNVEFWESNMDNLQKNEAFMERAKIKLIAAMEKEISENIVNFKSLYKK
jgi:hypothetical protein